MSSADIDLGDLPPLLTPRHLSPLVYKSEDALANDRYFKRGIPWTHIGGRIYYLRSDVIKYLAANRHETVDQA